MFPFSRKKSRNLNKPELKPDDLKDSGYLVVPRQLIHCANYGLKPAHLSVLLYLLSKPATWQVDYAHMSAQLGIGETYAPKYVTELREKGFLSFERNAKGETTWRISLPEFKNAEENKPLEPHRQILDGEILHSEIVAPLLTTKETETTKKTTNEGVKKANFDENDRNDCGKNDPEKIIFPESLNGKLSDSDQKAIVKELQKINDSTLKSSILTALVAAILSGNIKNPIGYAHVLVKKANEGTFTAPATAAKVLTPLEKEKQAKQKLSDFMTSNLDKLKRDFLELKKDYIHISGLGNITRSNFDDFLAVAGV